MTKKWIGTQIVLNHIAHHLLQEKDYLKKKLALAKDYLDLDALIIWPDQDNRNLDLTRDICQDLGIKTYLWYPILADHSLFKVRPSQAVETFDGLHGYGINGCWDQLGQGEEKFLFLCPNVQEEIQKIFAHYQQQIVSGGFDGVFLDRIRFPSPANGLETLLTCFCPSCLEKFRTNYQEDLNDYRDRAKEIFQALRKVTIKDLKSSNTLFQLLMNNKLKYFFDFRKQSILQIVKMFAHEAKQRGKRVGLDLFAPSIAPLVAQDYSLLAETCDWMKPMVYCHAKGPAGLPLELSCLLKAILNLNPTLDESLFIQKMSSILGVHLPGSVELILENGITEKIISQEMQQIRDFQFKESVKIYIGLEAVQIPGICEITQGILEKYLRSVLELDLEGMVLSWNLLKIPDEHIKWVGDFLFKQS